MEKKLLQKKLLFLVCVGVTLLLPSLKATASLAEEIPRDLGFITATEYVVFLNEEASSDLDHLYDDKMSSEVEDGSIRRLGEPGNYHYEAISEKEFNPVLFLSQNRVAQYAFWKGSNISGNSATSHVDQELQLNQGVSTLPEMRMAGVAGTVVASLLQRLCKLLFVTAFLTNGRGAFAIENQPRMEEPLMQDAEEINPLYHEQNIVKENNFSGPVVFGGNVTIHYHDLGPALGEFEKQGRDLAEMKGQLEHLHQLVGVLVEQHSSSEEVRKTRDQAQELEKKEIAVRQIQHQLAGQIESALTEGELVLRENIKLGKKETFSEAAQWCDLYELVNRQLHRYESENNNGVSTEMVSFSSANPLYLFCHDIEKLTQQENILKDREETVSRKEADLGKQDLKLKNEQLAVEQEKLALTRRIALLELGEKKQEHKKEGPSSEKKDGGTFWSNTAVYGTAGAAVIGGVALYFCNRNSEGKIPKYTIGANGRTKSTSSKATRSRAVANRAAANEAVATIDPIDVIRDAKIGKDYAEKMRDKKAREKKHSYLPFKFDALGKKFQRAADVCEGGNIEEANNLLKAAQEERAGANLW